MEGAEAGPKSDSKEKVGTDRQEVQEKVCWNGVIREVQTGGLLGGIIVYWINKSKYGLASMWSDDEVH